MDTQEKTGQDTVRRALEAMAIAPLKNLALINGKSFRPFLSEISGLSSGRIAQGNLEKLRLPTIKRIQETANAWCYETAKKKSGQMMNFQ